MRGERLLPWFFHDTFAHFVKLTVNEIQLRLVLRVCLNQAANDAILQLGFKYVFRLRCKKKSVDTQAKRIL